MEGFSELNPIRRGPVEEGKRVVVEVGAASIAHGGEERESGVEVAGIDMDFEGRVPLARSQLRRGVKVSGRRAVPREKEMAWKLGKGVGSRSRRCPSNSNRSLPLEHVVEWRCFLNGTIKC